MYRAVVQAGNSVRRICSNPKGQRVVAQTKMVGMQWQEVGGSFTFKSKANRFSDKLDVRCEIKGGVKDDAKCFGSSNWQVGVIN